MSPLSLLATLCNVLLFKLFWLSSMRAEVFNIVTMEDDHCTPPCITLSDFAANQSDNNITISSNITLILAPGRHILQVNFSTSNLDMFAMYSYSSTNGLPAQVVCEQRSSIYFEDCLSISINSIDFIGCHKNTIRLVRDFKLQNSVFEGQAGGGSSSGSAITLSLSTALIYNCKFISDIGGNVTRVYPDPESGCVAGGAILAVGTDLFIKQSLFEKNVAGVGGALSFFGSNVRIESSNFTENEAEESERGFCDSGYSNTFAGAVFLLGSNVKVSNSIFSGNSAKVGGSIACLFGVLSINTTNFHDNKAKHLGGAVYSQYCTMTMDQVVLARNAAENDSVTQGGGAITCSDSNVTIGDSRFDDNLASFGAALYVQNSSITFEGDVLLTNNWGVFGVLYAFNTSIAIHGSLFVSNNSAAAAISGPLTLFQSNVMCFGRAIFKGNEAETGAAIYSSETKVDVIGEMKILNNSARNNGGGIYLYQGELDCQQGSTLTLMGNRAEQKGGAIHAIGTTLKINAPINRTILTIESNRAQTGGGICFESNAKLYTVKWYGFYSKLVQFIGNSADYGGAVYVDDDTYAASCIRQNTAACFFQELILLETSSEGISLEFKHNQATERGSNIFGGLLHRCSIVQPIIQGIFFNSNSYFRRVANVSSVHLVSSRPVRVCMCTNGHPNCTVRRHSSYVVKKGEKFSISLVAVDQIEHPVSATIQSLLGSNASGLLEGQLTRTIAGGCTDLDFNIISPKNSEKLSLYASDGPCRNAESAIMTVDVQFLPCTCPIGFQPSHISDVNCTCDCHDDIVQYVSKCDTLTQSLIKLPQTKAWITSASFDNSTGYTIYPNCPYDYCKYGQTLSVNLNQPNGADTQCAFGRSSLLCGSCRSGLSLSLGSSRCIQCPSYWPVLFVVISVAAVIAGVVLVAVLLLLNMTVTVGTLNGLILYANILSANKSILLPVQESDHLTFANIVVSWLNLDIGIDSCYFHGMNTYTKTWLQLAFPAYVLVLVAAIIVCSAHISKFADLISKKNPVATLATLILLSYTKMLEIAFQVLSSGTVSYPDGSQSKVWLPDATMEYFSIKHSLLFIVSVIILLVGLIYTILLFSWQWLLRLPKRVIIFKWLNNQKLHGFMETYNIPYKPQHRYWTGMLLFVRVILYLIAAVNVSNDAQLALTSIVFIIGSIFFLKASIGGRLYRNKLVDVIETAFYFSILAFTTLTWYAINKKIDSYNSVIVNTSMIVTLLLLLLIILYHLYVYTPLLSRKMGKTAVGNKLNTVLISLQDPVEIHQNPRRPSDRFNDDFLDTIENANDHELMPARIRRERELTHTDVVIHTPVMQRAQCANDVDDANSEPKKESGTIQTH